MGPGVFYECNVAKCAVVSSSKPKKLNGTTQMSLSSSLLWFLHQSDKSSYTVAGTRLNIFFSNQKAIRERKL